MKKVYRIMVETIFKDGSIKTGMTGTVYASEQKAKAVAVNLNKTFKDDKASHTHFYTNVISYDDEESN